MKLADTPDLGSGAVRMEDDEDISMVEQAYLEAAGFEVVLIKDGAEVISFLEREQVDLILLDVMLPGKDGFAICKEIRDKQAIPILMVTARSETLDKIKGLGTGADDYIVKPFDPMELVARVHANLRQFRRSVAPKEEPTGNPDELVIGDLRILKKSWIVYKGDREIKFPNREFELLVFLAEHPNIVFSKEQLFEKIWGYDYVGDSATVMVHINRIREKIEDDSKNPTLIETVWGAGYRFNRN